MKHRLTERVPQTILTIILVLSSFGSFAQDYSGDAGNGKSLFNSNCASCHKLDKKMIGPALGDVTERRSKEWLVKWVKDNAALRASGDAEAKAIFEEFNGSVMPAFPNLSESDVEDILTYTIEGAKPVVDNNGGGGTGGEEVAAESDNTVILLVLGAILALLIMLLVRVKNVLKAVKGQPTSTLV
ncbi:MAG TPA: cytochrome C, partial [Cryomorphaceae bacterium]|nr:cytochrome C [Cryomorphaceae bacterium]